MRTKSTNPRLRKLIKELQGKEGIWKALGKELDKPNSRRAEVNLYKLNRELEEGEIGLVPGKVLGYGEVDHSIKIGAINYSEKASEKIKNQKGKPRTIEQVIEEGPDKSKMKIIK